MPQPPPPSAPPTPPARVEPAAPAVEPPPKSQWKATASATQEDLFPASNACDGKTDTRWSSPAADPNWLQIDMGRAATVCGLAILWETAFSSEYSIETSLDGNEWTETYSQKKGDGATDEIYLRPVQARFVKIIGLKRGTGWGHSIWEVDIKGPSEQPLIQAVGRPGSDPLNLMDGRLDTSWMCASPAPCSITIDLRKEKALGGVRVDWGTGYAADAALYESADGSAWTKMSEVKEGLGAFDMLLHPRATARYLRLDLGAGVGQKAVEIREISIRGPDETATPLSLYQVAAEKMKPGSYPDQLLKRQVYWTVVGLPGDDRESLLDEYGNLEPRFGAPSIMPYVYSDGALLSAFDAKSVTQSLEGGYLPLPGVAWDLGALQFTVQALAIGSTSNSMTFIRYRLSNASTEPRKGRLFLAIRPVQVNPSWQYGGLTPIRSMESEATPEGVVVKVNGSNLFVSMTAPDGFGVRPFDQGDIARDLHRGLLPAASKLDSAGELLSGALAYDFDLKPGESRSVVAAAPLHDTLGWLAAFPKHGYGEVYESLDAAFDARLQEMRQYWSEQVDKVSLDLPARDVVNTLKSQLAYILVNKDGPAIEPGSRNYKRAWMRDGALTGAALLRLGLAEPVREFLDWYAERIQPDGLVPPILNNDGTVNGGFGSNLEYDSQGEFVYGIMEYYRFTGDKNYLAKYFDKMVLALQYLIKLRDQTMAPDYMKDEPGRERFVGILPKSYSHEGYSPPMHSYWDDFFALKGWKDGRDAFLVLGRTNEAAWADEQYQLFRASLKASIEMTIAFKGIDYIPGCAEKGDMDATSTTIGLFPCEEMDILPRALLEKMYQRYFDEIVGRSKPGWAGGFTPYEVRNINAFVLLGRKDQANYLLDYIMSCRRPAAWNHLAEVVLSDPRMGSYIGDMPHTWVGAGFVNAVRGMLVRERDGRLVLLAGAPEQWVRDGEGISLRHFPTFFGVLDLTARASGRTLTVTLGGSANAPSGVELYWPIPGKPVRVVVDGNNWSDYDEAACRCPGMVKQITAEWAVE
ncbi:MAG: discoidin domain-containing protein [Verrucomicrobiota bacterium]